MQLFYTKTFITPRVSLLSLSFFLCVFCRVLGIATAYFQVYNHQVCWYFTFKTGRDGVKNDNSKALNDHISKTNGQNCIKFCRHSYYMVRNHLLLLFTDFLSESNWLKTPLPLVGPWGCRGHSTPTFWMFCASSFLFFYCSVALTFCLPILMSTIYYPSAFTAHSPVFF